MIKQIFTLQNIFKIAVKLIMKNFKHYNLVLSIKNNNIKSVTENLNFIIYSYQFKIITRSKKASKIVINK